MTESKTLYTVKELAECNGGPIPMSVSGIYNACRSGEIPTIKIGSRVFIHQNTIKKLLNL